MTLRPVALALLSLVVAAAALALQRSASADERPGRVVRVERPRVGVAARVQGCLSYSMDLKNFTCFGPRPEDDVTLRVVDQRGQIGIARIVKSEPSAHDRCNAGVAYDVELEYEDGLAHAASNQGISIPAAVSGVEADPRAVKVVSHPNAVRSPSGRQRENVWIALDRDGDGAVDFAATAHDRCQEAAADAPVAPAGGGVHSLCLDYWVRHGADWRVVNRDRYYHCY